MKKEFRAVLNPIYFEAKDLEEANEIISEVLIDADITCKYIEKA